MKHERRIWCSLARRAAWMFAFAPCFALCVPAAAHAEESATASLAERFIANASGHASRPATTPSAQQAAVSSPAPRAPAPAGGSFFNGTSTYDGAGCAHCGGAHSADLHGPTYGPAGPEEYESLVAPGTGFMDQGAAGGTYHFLPRDWNELVNGSVRHKGLGVPLLRESWNYRPWHVDWFVGVMWGDDMGKYQAERGGGAIGGFRLGEDWGNYLGWETRLAFASLDMNNFGSDYWLDDTEDFYWDTSVVYYPWGDSLWRPYFSIGLGLARFQFYKNEGARADETSFSLPLGMGLKYRYSSWLAFRLDFTDNASFAGGLPWMNSYSLTAGMEFHFGGRRRSYQAWNPGRHHW